MKWVEEDAKARGAESVRMQMPVSHGVTGCRMGVQESEGSRLMALEVENLRLTRLVGELLAKNQQLRESLAGLREF